MNLHKVDIDLFSDNELNFEYSFIVNLRRKHKQKIFKEARARKFMELNQDPEFGLDNDYDGMIRSEFNKISAIDDVPLDIKINNLLHDILHQNDRTKFLVALVQVRKVVAKLE